MKLSGNLKPSRMQRNTVSLREKFLGLLTAIIIVFFVRASYANDLENAYAQYTQKVEYYRQVRNKIASIDQEIRALQEGFFYEQGFFVSEETSGSLVGKLHELSLEIAIRSPDAHSLMEFVLKRLPQSINEGLDALQVKKIAAISQYLEQSIVKNESASLKSTQDELEEKKRFFKIFLWISSLVLVLLAILMFMSMYRPISALLKMCRVELDSPSNELGKISSHVEQMADQAKTLENQIFLQSEEMNKRLFYNDLTGLPNRNKLLHDLESDGFLETIVLLNIDEFHFINDSYGDMFGDYVLKALALRIAQSVKDSCVIYKLHADEFAIG
ncbi:diguanylate cyclase, partial [Sulfurospirillum sp. T05]